MPPRKVQNVGEALSKVEGYVQKNRVIIFSKSWCPFCQRVKALFDGMKVQYKALELDEMSEDQQKLWMSALKKKTGLHTVPNVFVKKNHIGGHDDTVKAHKEKRLETLLA